MQKIIAFAIFSTWRQEEIVSIRWDGSKGDRVLVRDMKHAGDKVGNHTWCELPPEKAEARCANLPPLCCANLPLLY